MPNPEQETKGLAELYPNLTRAVDTAKRECQMIGLFETNRSLREIADIARITNQKMPLPLRAGDNPDTLVTSEYLKRWLTPQVAPAKTAEERIQGFLNRITTLLQGEIPENPRSGTHLAALNVKLNLTGKNDQTIVERELREALIKLVPEWEGRIYNIEVADQGVTVWYN